jgi:hypothetical protein
MSTKDIINEKFHLPEVTDKCPGCESKERMGMAIIDELDKLGVIKKADFKDGLVFNTPLINQRSMRVITTNDKEVSIISIYWDVCKSCKTMYATKIEFNTKIMRMPPSGMM